MDGFYVAKFKICKPAKATKENGIATLHDAVPTVNGVTDEDFEEEAVTFDDAEDFKVMEAEKLKALKRKGIKVISKEKQIAQRNKRQRQE